MKKGLLPPVSPAEMLTEEFLKPMGISNSRLAREIYVSSNRVDAIAAGRHPITADMDLRLCRFLGLSEGWWSRLQIDHDIRRAKAELAVELAKIKPWAEKAAKP